MNHMMLGGLGRNRKAASGGGVMTLKTTGLATSATMVLAVDIGSGLVKEWVSSTVDSGKTVPGTVTYGTASWKSTTRDYFETYANGPFGSDPILFPTNRPSFPMSTGASVFVASAGLRAAGVDQRAFVVDETTGAAFGRSNSTGNKPCWFLNNGARYTATTDSPAQDVAFSVGSSIDMDTSGAFFYGLESGSLAADGTFSPSGWTNMALVTQIGGWQSNGNNPGRWHCVATFSGLLTLSDFQSLHNDWFGTLFDVA